MRAKCGLAKRQLNEINAMFDRYIRKLEKSNLGVEIEDSTGETVFKHKKTEENKC